MYYLLKRALSALLLLILLTNTGCDELALNAENFAVTSSTFSNGVITPKLKGTIFSPQLSWESLPEGTRTLIITLDDGHHAYWAGLLTDISEGLPENDPFLQEKGHFKDDGFELPTTFTGNEEVTLSLFALSTPPKKIIDKINRLLSNPDEATEIEFKKAAIHVLLEKLKISDHLLGIAETNYYTQES